MYVGSYAIVRRIEECTKVIEGSNQKAQTCLVTGDTVPDGYICWMKHHSRTPLHIPEVR